MITRRSFLTSLAAVSLAPLAAACKKDPRCAHCGMKIDPSSAWNGDVDGEEKRTFDTPRCAFAYWLASPLKSKTTVFVRDYYARTPQPAHALRFVVGSDVLGPMGPDLVPVAPERVDKFVADHGGHALASNEVTQGVLEGLK